MAPPKTQEAEAFEKYYLDRRDKELPENPEHRALVESCVRDGYVVIPSVFTAEECEEAKAEIDRLHGERPLVGRSQFEGRKTNRMWALIGKSRVFDKFVLVPQVHALNEYFLTDEYLIYILSSIVIQAGEKAQFLHHDDAGTRMPRPRPPMSVGTMICLDAFTPTNGATRIVPGSHQWGDRRIAYDEEAIPAVAPQGSVIYFLGTTWHSGGANQDEEGKARYAITAQYCMPWLRPFEDLKTAVDPRRVLSGEIDERIVEMMGYRTVEPYWGVGKSTTSERVLRLLREFGWTRLTPDVVDGMNPIKGAQRLVRWLQGPVETDQPGFAKEKGVTDKWFRERYSKESSKL